MEDASLGNRHARCCGMAIAASLAVALLLFACADTAFAYIPEQPDASLETASGAIRKPFYTHQGYGYLNVFYLKTSSKSKAVPGKVKITKVASIQKKHKHKKKKRKKSVATVQKRGGGILVYFNKPGSVRLAYTWKGKMHRVILRATAYKNPLKRMTIGSAKLAKHYRQGNDYTGTARGKLAVASAAGWKLLSIHGSTDDGWSYPRKLSNNAQIPEDITDVRLVLRNVNTGLRQEIYYHRST